MKKKKGRFTEKGERILPTFRSSSRGKKKKKEKDIFNPFYRKEVEGT